MSSSSATGGGRTLAYRWPLVGALTIIILAIVVIALVIAGRSQEVPLPDLTRRLQDINGPALADEQTRREIVRLELANLATSSPWSPVLALVPIGSALVALITIGAAIWKQVTDRSDQRRRELAERERENQRRFNETFQTTVTNLAATSDALRGSAAITLGTFLRPEYATYHDDVILVALAKSKEGMEENEHVRRLVARSLEQGLRARLPEIPQGDRRYFLDLAHAQLDRIDLSGLDLTEADIAFASLRYSDLRNATLFRVRGFGVDLEGARLGGPDTDLREARLRSAHAPKAQFHDADCISIRFEEAQLQQAEFQGARLQEAHFEGADLTGARFESANINNAYFAGATLDALAIKGLTRARNWRAARFDEAQRARLPHDAVEPGSSTSTSDASTTGTPSPPDANAR